LVFQQARNTVTWSKQIRTAWAAALAAALAVTASPAVAAEQRPSSALTATAGPQVAVTGIGKGAYRIEGSFAVEASALVAWAVLTDYDNLSSFVSSMRSSSATRADAGRQLVTQEAVGRAGPFSRTLRVVLEVTENPPAHIAFHDVCGESFRSYVGNWTIDPDGGDTRVTYMLEAWPRSSPPFFARSILASNARVLLEQVKLEMLRRGRTASAR
jgi:carbon monoxide dehydrogenase subunit G